MLSALQVRKEMTIDDIKAAAPSIFAVQPYEGVSERYDFIPTSDIVNSLFNNGFIPVMASEIKVRNLSKKGFSKHIMRWRHSSTMLSGLEDIPEIVITNSHDRTSAYTIQAGIFRMVCSNGLVVCSESFEKLSIKHMGNQVDKVIEGSFKIIENLPEIMQSVNNFKTLQLTDNQKLEYASEALKLAPTTLTMESRDLLAINRFADTGNDLYKTFNTVQENLIRGNVSGQSVTGKFRKARPITGITADTKLNSELWALTENTFKLLAA